jgi:hypothetical protein
VAAKAKADADVACHRRRAGVYDAFKTHDVKSIRRCKPGSDKPSYGEKVADQQMRKRFIAAYDKCGCRARAMRRRS